MKWGKMKGTAARVFLFPCARQWHATELSEFFKSLQVKKVFLGVKENLSPFRFYTPGAKTSELNGIQEEEIRDFKLGILVHWANKASVTDLLPISKTLCSPHYTICFTGVRPCAWNTKANQPPRLSVYS